MVISSIAVSLAIVSVPRTPDMKYILVTGLIRNDETAQMEILSEDGTTVICPNAKNKYPDNLSSASGAVTDGTTIVACGGNDVFLLGPVRSCYSYGEDSNWNKLAHMSISRDGR